MRRTVLAAITVGLGGCAAVEVVDPAAARGTGAAAEEVAFRRLAEAGQTFALLSALLEPSRLVIRDRDDWARVWGRIWAQQVPQPPLPEVDFGREMVVVAAMGTRGSGGYTITFEEARRTGERLQLTVHSRSPSPNCGTLAVITNPVDVAIVARTEGEVTFEERSSVIACP